MSRLFANIPSVNDLLESAPLKGVVDRVGRNRVVAETARYLDRLRLQAQSAAQQALQFTTQDLAQRVARWIIATGTSGQRSIINATGVLLPSDLAGPPLATEAIDAMAHSGGAYQSGDQASAVASRLNQLAGVEAALVFATPSAAMLAALAALGSGREVVLRRGELERDRQEVPLDELALTAHCRICEVGSVNETTVDDYVQAVDSQAAMILSIALRHSAAACDGSPALRQLAEAATRKSLPLLADLGWSGVTDLAEFGIAGLTTIGEARSAGADLILVRGHGVLGGPACGILAGRSELIEQVGRHTIARSSKASPAVLAALNATLQLHEDQASALRTIPVLSLISTPLENLRLRAERLAPQIAAMSAITSAEAVERKAVLSRPGRASEEIASWGVAIQVGSGAAADLAAQLLSSTQAIAAVVEGDRVVLDLRSASPKYDLAIVDAFTALGGGPEQVSVA
jgi:L-seryl-tRNA(Ser) seleniumtransferase